MSLQGPQVGGLANERRPANPCDAGKEMRAMAPEVLENLLVLAKPEALADDFRGDRLAVPK